MLTVTFAAQSDAFLSTLPVRGATVANHITELGRGNFYPRSP